jgi:hypothetical protein
MSPRMLGRLGPVTVIFAGAPERLSHTGRVYTARVIVEGAREDGAAREVGALLDASLEGLRAKLGRLLAPLTIAPHACPTCDGTGVVVDGVGIVHRTICPTCHRLGYLPCDHCIEDRRAVVVVEHPMGGPMCARHLAVHLAEDVEEMRSERACAA